MERKGQEGVPEGYKRCSKCGEVKLAGEFSKKSSGFLGVDSQCKCCRKAYIESYNKTMMTDEQKERYRKKHYNAWLLKHPPKPADIIPDGKKRCSKCKEVKDISDFSKGKNSDGLRSQCKACCAEYYKLRGKDSAAKYYQKNIEKILERNREWIKNNPEKRKEYKKTSRRRMAEKLAPDRERARKSIEEQRLLRKMEQERIRQDKKEKRDLDRSERLMYNISHRDETKAIDAERQRGYYQRTQLRCQAQAFFTKTGAKKAEIPEELIELKMKQIELIRALHGKRIIGSHKEVTNG